MDDNKKIVDFLKIFLNKNNVDKDLYCLRCLIKAFISINNEDNIMEKIYKRLEIGKERYGHGIRINDDTTEYGTEKNDWLEMCEEEILDGILYSIANHLRKK